MKPQDVLNHLEAFRVAYNQVDASALAVLVAEDIQWGHRNKFQGNGRAALIASIEEFARKAPGRYFEPPERFAVNGDLAFVEQPWRAVPAFSDPAWGWQEGVPVSMTTCSLFVLSDGMITEWSDHG